ncbi:MAG TPA: putative 2-aminoethylphosphonate ABC transporter ATP-binding protein [Alphaproteobacteria bacterium]
MTRSLTPAADRRDRPYLQIEEVTKRFGAFTALDRVSLEVFAGEFVCFLGPSGCGKTTLLRAIAGLDPQTSGRILQEGRDISRLPPSKRDFGIVFQSYALFPNLTVEKNVAYGLDSRHRPRAEVTARVKELLELVGLPSEGPKYPAQLSGGQQQRVALARALATSPGLLLLDEPLSALDARVRVRLRHEIRSLHRRLGVTTIMVTHDQEEALTMADRIVVMNQGVIDQVGTPVEIYRHPQTPFVADFVGSMNFLSGIVVAPGRVRAAGTELAYADGAPHLPQGSAVSVCLRPEDVAIRGVGPGQENVVPARILDLEFLGSFCRGTLEPLQGEAAPILADFSINAVRDLELDSGRDVLVRLPPDRLRVFAAG